MPDSPTIQQGNRVRVVTASRMNFRGEVREVKEDWFSIFDERSRRVIAFSYRAVERVEVEE